MQAFLTATNVRLTVPLQDKSGNLITVSAIGYRIIDQNDVEIIALTALTGFVPGAVSAVIDIPALQNTLAPGVARELRSVEMYCVVATNTITLNAAYAIELADPLQVGVNSFQSYAQAQFTSLSIPNLPGWNAAQESERIAALIDARSHIVQLNFSQLNSNVNWGQGSLNFVSEGTYPTNYAVSNGMFVFNGNLSLLSVEQFGRLPGKFVEALKLAQMAEADDILGGDPIEAKRREGILLETIGESKMMFRTGRPLRLPVSRRALAYLSYFVTFSKRVGRG